MSGMSMLVRMLVVAIVASGWSQAAERKPAAADAATKGAKVVGIVTAKSDKDIMVKAEGENEAKRYLLAPESGCGILRSGLLF